MFSFFYYCNCMNILIIFIFFFFCNIFCIFIDIEKISDNGDYFVVLDNGLYIYNFEKTKCKFIRDINESKFDENNINNNIIISKNKISGANTMKIAVLINEHLYVYTYSENNEMIEYVLLHDLVNNEHNIYPFNIQIDNYELIINFISFERHLANKYFFIKSYTYQNYLQTEKSEKKYNDYFTTKPFCQLNNYDININCFSFKDSNFQFKTINNLYNFGKKNENDEFTGKVTFTFSQSVTLLCFSKKSETKCLYKQTTNSNFQTISYSFKNECLELKANYFQEKIEFVLVCKKNNYLYLYIFDENNINANIKVEQLFIENYNGKSSFILNKTINSYAIVYDYNFTIICEEYNQAKEFVSFSTIEISEDREKYYETSEILLSSEIDKTDFIDRVYISNRISQEKEIIEESGKIIDIGEIIKEKTLLSKEQIIYNITNIIKDTEIGKNYEIIGKGFTIIIKPTNSTSFQNSTHVDFDECEGVLREKYNITNSSIITFLQMEIKKDDQNALYNQIKYFTYDDKKQELDLNLCNDIETQIHYNLKEDSNIDILAVDGFKKKGIDIFNIKDEFFNNICTSFSDSDNDMILEDRIKYIFQNYSLCEDGCTYNNFNLETTSITCNCKIKGNFNETMIPLIFEQGKEASFLDSNIGVIKCYNLVFKLNNKLNNLGFLIFSVLIFFYFIFFFYFIIKGIKSVSNFVFNEMVKYGYLNKGKKGNFEIIINKQPKKIETTTSSQKSKRKVKCKKNRKINMVKVTKNYIIKKNSNEGMIKDNRDLLNSNFHVENIQSRRKNIFKQKHRKVKSLCQNNEEEGIDNFGIIKININKNIKDYFPKDSNQNLYNYTLDEAQKYDKRNIFRILYIYLLAKQIIFHTFFLSSPFELFSLRLTLFIFMLACDLALNALFYLNDNISKKYHYAKNIFIFAFSNNLTIIIYSTLLSYFLMIFLMLLSNSSNAIRNVFQKEEQKLRIKKRKKYIIDDYKKKEIYDEILNIFRRYKIKLFFLFFFQIILIIFFWYFVTAFCHVYSSTQTSWLFDSFLSILSRFFIEIIFAFLFAKLYRISVSSNLKTLYKIIMCIYDFN